MIESGGLQRLGSEAVTVRESGELAVAGRWLPMVGEVVGGDDGR